jgi:drug/metabolite transporter (DMT)-like permease
MASRPHRIVLVAFAVFVVLAGANAIGVKLALVEMPPMWSAAVRFALAGVLLAGYVAVTRRPLPRGTALLGTTLFGALGVGLAYLFLYQALQSAPAGTAMLMLAVVPLLTVLLSVAQGTERLRRLGIIGAMVAGAGILIVSADQLTLDVPLSALLLLLAGALCIAESGVVVKRFPPGDPVTANAIGMILGGGILAIAAVLARETFVVPQQLDTWVAMLYLIGPGSVGVFVLVLFILARWTASATSYAFLLFPLVAVVLGAALLQEPVQPSFVMGGAVVLLGVYVGAVYRPKAATSQAIAEAPGERVTG